MDSIKAWVIDYLIKKGGPSFIRGLILAISGYLIAKQGLLAPLGVVYDASTHILSLNLDQANVYLVALLPALGAGVIKIASAHGSEIAEKITDKILTPPPGN